MSVIFNGTRQELVGKIRLLVGMLSGDVADTHRIGEQFVSAIGVAALADIKNDFILKAGGGAGLVGGTWPPLSREYLAYGRRFGPGEKKALAEGAGLNLRKNKFAPGGKQGLLTADQLKIWKRTFAGMLHRFMDKMGKPEAMVKAAMIAWAKVKKLGAKTKLEVYGTRKVDMLRDTGRMLNSLSPGILVQGGYSKPSGAGGSMQVFEANAGRVIVGTNVIYSGQHNYGYGKNKSKRRQFLPDTEAEVPQQWWDHWDRVAEGAMTAALTKYLSA